MDTSEIYIKMCEKAVEIQTDHGFIKGDYWTCDKKNLIFTYRLDELIGNYLKPDIETDRTPMKNVFMIFLPRQDQLQEMAIYKGNDKTPKFKLWMLINDFDLWGDKYINSNIFDSLDQLWLAFTMHEKYQKRWDSEKEDWVKEK